MTYRFKVWLINYSQFKTTENILDLYNPLDSKKLISTYFNLAAIKLGEKEFKRICPEYARRINTTPIFSYMFRFPRDVLNFLLFGCKTQYERRVKNHPIDIQIYPEDLFWEVVQISTKELDYKYPFCSEDDTRLISFEKSDRELLISESPHRYSRYKHIWKIMKSVEESSIAGSKAYI